MRICYIPFSSLKNDDRNSPHWFMGNNLQFEKHSCWDTFLGLPSASLYCKLLEGKGDSKKMDFFEGAGQPGANDWSVV